MSEGDCGYITRENGQKVSEKNETIAPICFALVQEENETRWVGQEVLMEKLGATSADCLNKE